MEQEELHALGERVMQQLQRMASESEYAVEDPAVSTDAQEQTISIELVAYEVTMVEASSEGVGAALEACERAGFEDPMQHGSELRFTPAPEVLRSTWRTGVVAGRLKMTLRVAPVEPDPGWEKTQVTKYRPKPSRLRVSWHDYQ
jgi:hypothetical protein